MTLKICLPVKLFYGARFSFLLEVWNSFEIRKERKLRKVEEKNRNSENYHRNYKSAYNTG